MVKSETANDSAHPASETAHVEIVFTPPGPRPQADLVAHWASVDQLIREGRINERTGMPPLLQLAVLLDRVPEAFRMPGPAGWLMKRWPPLGTFSDTENDGPEAPLRTR